MLFKKRGKGVARLGNGQEFPRLTALRVDGGELTLPDDLAGRCAVLLFYRGHW